MVVIANPKRLARVSGWSTWVQSAAPAQAVTPQIQKIFGGINIFQPGQWERAGVDADKPVALGYIGGPEFREATGFVVVASVRDRGLVRTWLTAGIAGKKPTVEQRNNEVLYVYDPMSSWVLSRGEHLVFVVGTKATLARVLRDQGDTWVGLNDEPDFRRSIPHTTGASVGYFLRLPYLLGLVESPLRALAGGFDIGAGSIVGTSFVMSSLDLRKVVGNERVHHLWGRQQGTPFLRATGVVKIDGLHEVLPSAVVARLKDELYGGVARLGPGVRGPIADVLTGGFAIEYADRQDGSISANVLLQVSDLAGAQSWLEDKKRFAGMPVAGRLAISSPQYGTVHTTTWIDIWKQYLVLASDERFLSLLASPRVGSSGMELNRARGLGMWLSGRAMARLLVHRGLFPVRLSGKKRLRDSSLRTEDRDGSIANQSSVNELRAYLRKIESAIAGIDTMLAKADGEFFTLASQMRGVTLSVEGRADGLSLGVRGDMGTITLASCFAAAADHFVQSYPLRVRRRELVARRTAASRELAILEARSERGETPKDRGAVAK